MPAEVRPFGFHRGAPTPDIFPVPHFETQQ